MTSQAPARLRTTSTPQASPVTSYNGPLPFLPPLATTRITTHPLPAPFKNDLQAREHSAPNLASIIRNTSKTRNHVRGQIKTIHDESFRVTRYLLPPYEQGPCHHNLRALLGNRPIMSILRGRPLGSLRMRCQGLRLLS